MTSPHLYSAGFTGDLALAVAHARRRYPGAALVGCGLSLGGNVMCKFLAERAGGTGGLQGGTRRARRGGGILRGRGR